MKTKPLIVYRASAGSGKTFTLAVRYISLLVKDPDNYRKILAVTFTNKATQEMKMRILSQLYGIANSLKSSDDYFNQVKQITSLEEFVIRNNAKISLFQLVHKYHEFRVLTIDSFFQQILHNLAHELGQTSNLRIDLNESQVESSAVDNMLEELEESQPIFKWIWDYIKDSIEEDKSWNVIFNIKNFGKNIFEEFYRTHESELNNLFSQKNNDFFYTYVKLLRSIKYEIASNLKSKVEDLISILEAENIVEHLRAYLYPYLDKLSNGYIHGKESPSYVTKCIENCANWTNSKCSKILKQEIALFISENNLNDKLSDIENYRKNNWFNYQSATLTLSHLSQLRLLNSISLAVDKLNKENNRFMLSNTQILLQKLISGNDTPFVFEKIGAQLEHMMIDEFQDTSTIQWNNFKSLLDNCISQEKSNNLIVGDIKQSIYRWRQGDWQLLNNIGEKFNEDVICIESLTKNFRSYKNIIDFNNAFFTSFVDTIIKYELFSDVRYGQMLRKAYSDVKQESVKQNTSGYVSIKLLPSNEYKANVLSNLCSTIRKLLSLGYNQRDIAILVRTKTVIPDIVSAISSEFDNTVTLISHEAFRLDASVSVNIIVSALQLISHPDDILTRGKLVKLYNENVKGVVDVSNLMVSSDNNVLSHLNKLLPKTFVTKFSSLLDMSIMDLVDQLFNIFELEKLKGQSSYISSFYDCLNDYFSEYPADIDDFIKEWEDNLSSTTIQSEGLDGISLLTIHKSKGLEFDNVIMPFCDWELEKHSDNILWCETNDKKKPFNTIPLVPIDYAKSELIYGTVYEADYLEEHFQNTIDNLNLIYVAFTRAVKNLFVYGKRMSDSALKNIEKGSGVSNRSQSIELSITDILKNLSDDITSLSYPKSIAEEISLEYGNLENIGNLQKTSKEITEKEINPFLIPLTPKSITVSTSSDIVEFRQSNKSKDFIREDDTETSDKMKYIKVGNVLHNIFSTIYTIDDIPIKLKELEQDGIVYNDDITTEKLLSQIEKSLSNIKVKEWFSKKWKVFNECSIIEYDSPTNELRTYRPDRVMSNGKKFIVVDFKFGKERKEYKFQVQKYMSLLKNMGHTDVEGYIWYVMKDIVEDVLP